MASALVLAPFISFVSTLAGAVVLAFRVNDLSPRTRTLLTGLSAGIMLGAAILSLLMPGIELYRAMNLGKPTLIVSVLLLLLAGAALMELIHSLTPHAHLIKGEPANRETLKRKFKRSWLLLFAMALHNLPEGLAVGLGAASGSTGADAAGWPLVTGIALQNVPETTMVCLAILATGGSRSLALLGTLVIACVEAGAAALASYASTASTMLLPAALILCAGAMLYVVSQEMIPESHSHGLEKTATFTLMLGFCLMTAATLALSKP